MTWRDHCYVDHQDIHRQMAERMSMLVVGLGGSDNIGRPAGWTRVLRASWDKQATENDIPHGSSLLRKCLKRGFADGIRGLDTDLN